jgi:hypothetical protein
MDNKPGKRKSRMNNIQSRMNSGSYDMAKFKANEKNLREKIAFFEKKDAKGELKDYMYIRLEEAKAMYEQLMALKSGAPVPPLPLISPVAVNAAINAAGGVADNVLPVVNQQRNLLVENVFPTTLSSIPAQARTTGIPKMTLKKLNRRRHKEATALAAASYVPPEFNPPTLAAATAPVLCHPEAPLVLLWLRLPLLQPARACV